tara:strand:+ start:14865 stop:15650 length:786 start_codon:yes stop_codon:yes gene_type:complete
MKEMEIPMPPDSPGESPYRKNARPPDEDVDKIISDAEALALEMGEYVESHHPIGGSLLSTAFIEHYDQVRGATYLKWREDVTSRKWHRLALIFLAPLWIPAYIVCELWVVLHYLGQRVLYGTKDKWVLMKVKNPIAAFLRSEPRPTFSVVLGQQGDRARSAAYTGDLLAERADRLANVCDMNLSDSLLAVQLDDLKRLSKTLRKRTNETRFTARMLRGEERKWRFDVEDFQALAQKVSRTHAPSAISVLSVYDRAKALNAL